jgi:hypothetical protein
VDGWFYRMRSKADLVRPIEAARLLVEVSHPSGGKQLFDGFTLT